MVWPCAGNASLPRVPHVTQATATKDKPCHLAQVKALTMAHVKREAMQCRYQTSQNINIDKDN